MRARLFTSKQVTALLAVYTALVESQNFVPVELAEEIDLILDELEISFNEVEFALEVE